MHANLGIASFLKESKKRFFLLNTEFFGVNANYQTMDRKCVLLENMRAKKFKLFGKLKNIKKAAEEGGFCGIKGVCRLFLLRRRAYTEQIFPSSTLTRDLRVSRPRYQPP